MLLANVELVLGQFEPALSHARQALTFSREHRENTAGPVTSRSGPANSEVSVAHMVAGNALKAEQRLEEAAAEYQAVLDETPQAPAAANAQAALARLHRPVAANPK